MKTLCLLLAASLGQGRPSADRSLAAATAAGEMGASGPSTSFIPSSLLAFQQPPGGFGGAPGFGMPMAGAGMATGGMIMPNGAMGGMSMNGMAMPNVSGTGMGTNGAGMSTMGMSGMGMTGGWDQFARRAQASAGSNTSTRPAEILSDTAQDELELTARQRRRLREIQKKVDEALDDLLTEGQKDYLQVMASRQAGRP